MVQRLRKHWTPPLSQSWTSEKPCCDRLVNPMWTQLEVFQRLDSRFRGNHKQGGNDEGDTFPRTLIRNWGYIRKQPEFRIRGPE